MSKAMSDLSTEQIAALPDAERTALEEQMTAQFAQDVDDGTDTGSESTTTTTTTAPAADEGADDDGAADVEDAATYIATAPEDAAAQIQAHKDAKTAARAEDRAALKKVNDGEMDFDEYDAIKDKTEKAVDEANDKIADLNKVISKAEISAEMTQQQTRRVWDDILKVVVNSAKAEGFDYMGNTELNKEMSGLMRTFAREAEERGISEEGLKASKWALAQAHSTMKMRHPELVTATTVVAQKPQEPGAPRHRLVTLGGLPSADRAPIVNDEVSRFAVVPGHQVAQNIAAMSKADAEKLFDSL